MKTNRVLEWHAIAAGCLLLDHASPSQLESVQDFFDQVGHETMYASSGNKHFSLNLVIIRLTKIMNRADKNWAQF